MTTGTAGRPPLLIATSNEGKLREILGILEGVPFVLLPEPGDPREGQRVEPGRVRKAIEELMA